MHEKILDTLMNISTNTHGIEVALKSQTFFNSQLFAAIIGAISALAFRFILELLVNRRKKLKEIYQELMAKKDTLTPESIIGIASGWSYGGEIYRGGKRVKITDPSLGEKSVIQLRKKVKYWQFPLSKLRLLFRKYEKALADLPSFKDMSMYNQMQKIKETKEYDNAYEVYWKISDFIERKTGETTFTFE